MGRNYTNFKGVKNPMYKTGMFTKGSKYNGLGTIWQGMKQRCLNKNHPKYHRYGGRGIKIYDEWLVSNNFFNWAVKNKWEHGLSIDRIDNDGDYCPENCRFVSIYENSRNKSTTKISFNQAIKIRERVANGESEYDLAKEFNVVHGTIWFIVNNFTHMPDGKCIKALKKRNKKNA